MLGFDAEEYGRWLAQARHTQASALRDLAAGDHAWSCFKSQQAGEYGLKALLRGVGRPAHGHSLVRLIRELQEAGLETPRGVMEAAQTLDRHYVPTRYPDAYPEGSPHEYYNEKVAREAASEADKVIAWVQSAA